MVEKFIFINPIRDSKKNIINGIASARAAFLFSFIIYHKKFYYWVDMLKKTTG